MSSNNRILKNKKKQKIHLVENVPNLNQSILCNKWGKVNDQAFSKIDRRHIFLLSRIKATYASSENNTDLKY